MELEEKELKQIKGFGPGDLRIVEVPIPDPKYGEVQIKVRANGICGSDKWFWRVEKFTDRVPGHEVSGEISAIGEGVKTLSVGDHVMVNSVVGCGKCPACRQGAFVCCEHWEGEIREGGYGEYICVPERNVIKMNSRLTFVEGAVIMDNWGTPYGALEDTSIQPGTIVVVTGLGPVGQAAVGLCASRGAAVIAVDPVEYRRKFALKMGASEAIEPGTDMISFIKKYGYGNGADVVVECSGQAMSYENGLRCLRIGGKFIIIGEGAEYLLKPSEFMIKRMLTIHATWYTKIDHARQLQKLTLDGTINPSSIVTHQLHLEEVPIAFKNIISCQAGIMKAVIVFD
jgi:threonine dehydrogenase-like Zn-dependent dehydrogenase